MTSMSNYDGWLEDPYTGGWECTTEECPVCRFECEECDGTGKSDNNECTNCDGTGNYEEMQSKSDHDDFYADDSREDD